MKRKGTKFSPSGYIPVEWKIKNLYKFATVQYGISDPLDRTLKAGIHIIGSPNVTHDGYYVDKPVYYVSPEKVIEKVVLQKGDILFNWRSGSKKHIGKTLYFDIDEKTTHVGFLLRIRMSNQEVNSRYLDIYLKFIKNREYFEKAKVQVNSSFNKEELLSLPVVVPTLPEQQKIATILSGWDKAIELVRKQIEAKQQLKKGLMQKLLTGKMRFPGFDGEWEEVSLNNLCMKEKGKKIDSTEEEVGLPYIGSTSFNGNFSKYSIDESGVRCTPKDILLLWDGEYAGKTTTGLDGYASSTVAVLRLDQNQVNNFYLQAVLEHRNQEVRAITEGSGIPHVPGDFLSIFKLKKPSLQEQQIVANLFSLINQDIFLLVKKIATLRQQKQGLMQKLLTGEVRVKV